MATLVTVQGPNPGHPFPLDPRCSLIGRRPDSTVFLESLAVSREHARILYEGGGYFVEDAGSSNGTYVNGRRIAGRVTFSERDTLQVGPYVFNLRPDPQTQHTESEQIIRSQVNALPGSLTLYAQNPALKLQVVIEIAQHLGKTLEPDALLGKLLDQLLRLFPQADRGMVLLLENEQLVVKAQRSRGAAASADFPYSRTIVKKALEDGVGILSEDVSQDSRFVGTATLMGLNLRSLLCVPLIAPDKRRLGVIQLDCSRQGQAFHADDLELLTTVSLQVAVVLENAALHAERLREERTRQELATAREIQQSFLPTEFTPLGEEARFELFASIHPARVVSGDLYDFFPLGDGRLAFALGDVSGKGIAAALFMVRVQTLMRALGTSVPSPSPLLTQLNSLLAVRNYSGMFVTLTHGHYDPRTGDVVLSSGAHPAPLVRRASGKVEEIEIPTGLPLGCLEMDPNVRDSTLKLAPGDTLILYTDGFVEAFAPGRKLMFGVDRLREVLGNPRTLHSLKETADAARLAIERFTGSAEQQDDLTILMLRHR